MVVSYDGTGFHGWQAQPGLRTVQTTLEEALARALGEPVRLRGAGRTDAGCHARGQVASFTTASRLPVRALIPALRPMLPPDLDLSEAIEAEDGFDARRSASARRYAYRLLDRDDMLLGRFAWHPRGGFDSAGLARAVSPLEGEHDCSAFQASGSSRTSSRCRIIRASWRRWEGGLQLDIIADHFLYRMVRNLIGTALMVQRAPDPARAMAAVLVSRDRRGAGPTAPPRGLCLEEVYYASAPIMAPGPRGGGTE